VSSNFCKSPRTGDYVKPALHHKRASASPVCRAQPKPDWGLERRKALARNWREKG
jgi:hypothetical protein